MTDLRQWLRDHHIAKVEAVVPDLAGAARGKLIPVKQFLEQGEPRLPESVLLQMVTGDYCARHWDLVEPTDADMLLRPDPGTARLAPWAPEPTAQIIHDCHTMDGEPHPLATRNVLRRVLRLYMEEGWRPVVAPEVEFYLVAECAEPRDALRPPVDRAGRAESPRQSYGLDALQAFREFIADLYDCAQSQQLGIDTLVHEMGAAQLEVNFLHGDPLALADQVFAFKRSARQAARRHALHATFMARPMQGEAGSALHIHQSLVDAGSGENLFVDRHGKHNRRFMSYIAGLRQYTPQLVSLYAPTVNSYRRLAPGISAPINLHWGYDNRTVAFRVPPSPPAATRVENRFPGADANPYLAIAASLASGYLGMRRKLEPGPPHPGLANEDAVEVARSLEEGLRALHAEPGLVEIFGERFLRAYAAVKLDEFEAFNQVITAWERQNLLLNV